MIKIDIPDLPLRPNQMLRKHWSFVMKEKKKWHNLIAFYCPRYDGKPMATAKVTLIRRSTHPCDFDGLVGSFKYVLDGLVKLGVLEDDKYEVIGEPEYKWEKVKRDSQGIVVVIEEMEV